MVVLLTILTSISTPVLGAPGICSKLLTPTSLLTPWRTPHPEFTRLTDGTTRQQKRAVMTRLSSIELPTDPKSADHADHLKWLETAINYDIQNSGEPHIHIVTLHGAEEIKQFFSMIGYQETAAKHPVRILTTRILTGLGILVGTREIFKFVSPEIAAGLNPAVLTAALIFGIWTVERYRYDSENLMELEALKKIQKALDTADSPSEQQIYFSRSFLPDNIDILLTQSAEGTHLDIIHSWKSSVWRE